MNFRRALYTPRDHRRDDGTWIFHQKPDLSLVLNGSLAGLVEITAGPDVVSANAAMIIGFIAGVIVVGSALRSWPGGSGPSRAHYGSDDERI